MLQEAGFDKRAATAAKLKISYEATQAEEGLSIDISTPPTSIKNNKNTK
jgi:hypothetical protein